MFLSKPKIFAAVAVAIGAAAAGLGEFQPRRAAAQQEPARNESGTDRASRLAAAAEKTPDDIITVRGRVVGPEGEPLAGAKLYLGHYGSNDEVAVTEMANSDADGRFEFRLPKSQLSKAHPDRPIGRTFGAITFERFETQPTAPSFTPVGQVVAVGEGYGCDWTRIDTAADGAELNLRLVKDVPISGQILSEEGNPIAGAKLHLSSVQAYPGESLEAALAAFRKSDEFPGGAKGWGGPLPGQAKIVAAGPDGWFSVAGLGGERYVSLHIEGPGIASADFQVITRPGDAVVGRVKVEVAALRPDKDGFALDGSKTISVAPKRVYGATFRYLAAASRPIVGVVTDKLTGKPLADVEIRVAPTSGGHGMLIARTDAEGRYEALGCPKSPAYRMVALPSDAGRYFAVERSRISDAPGIGPMAVDIKPPQGIPIRGKVVDERTGEPIAGARVNYFFLQQNAAQAIAFAEYDFAGSNAITGADGSFAVASLGGPGLLVASAPDSSGRAPSGAYRPGKIAVKEWGAFVAKYKVPPGLDPIFTNWDDTEKHEVVACVPTDVRGPGLLQIKCFNSAVLLHPDENDNELKQDLKLRPAGEWKFKIEDFELDLKTAKMMVPK